MIKWPALIFPPINLYSLPNPKAITPCVGMCKLENDVCTGCKRTITEIREWATYDATERLEIMQDLRRR